MKDLTVFISYSWDSQEHKEWVRKLADYLIEKGGIDVILDQYDLKAGNVMTYFMESSIEKADKVLLILTPGYKARAEAGKGGVSFEHSIISAGLYQVQNDNSKFIPVLRDGDKVSSSPGYIKTLIYHDMTNDDQFESDAFSLVRELYESPEIIKPPKGAKPDLTQFPDPILERASHVANEILLSNRRKAFANTSEASLKIGHELIELFKAIKEKSLEYKAKTDLYIKSDYNDRRVILNINGIGANLYYKNSYERPIEENELIFSLWNKPLSLDNSEHYYFPDEEPKELAKHTFNPQFDNKLNVRWSNKKLEFQTKELNGFIYSTLLDLVKKERA